MARTRSGGQAVKWVNRKFGSYTVKLLDVSRAKGRKRWPEIVLLQVPGPAKKKLQSRNALCEFLNEQDVFSQPARKVVRSVSLPSVHTVWYLIVIHARTSTLTAVWVPAP
jgi:hypothetical protein